MSSGISLYKLITNDYREFQAVNTVRMMRLISFQIEDTVINNELPVDLYAGFQRFSAFMPQVERYKKLARVARRIFVFGFPDVTPPVIPGIEYISLTEDDYLIDEWFLVINAPNFFTSLLTHEVEGDDLSGGRRFEGLWTHNEEIINRAYLLLSQRLNLNYQPIGQRDYNQQNNFVVDIANRLVARLERNTAAQSRSLQLTKAIDGVSKAAAENDDYETMLDAIVAVLQKSFKARTITVWQKSDEAEMIEISAAAGLPNNWRRAIYRQQAVDDTELMAAVAFKGQEQIYIRDTDTEQKSDLFDPAVRTILALPLLAYGRFLGILQLTSHIRNAFDGDFLQSINALAGQIALALAGRKNDQPVQLPESDEENNEALVTVLNSTLDGILVLNGNKTVRFINQAATAILGVPSIQGATLAPSKLGNPHLESFIVNLEPEMGMLYMDLTTADDQEYLVGAAPAYHTDNIDEITHWTIVIRSMRDIGVTDFQSASPQDKDRLISQIKIGNEVLKRVQSISMMVQELPGLGNLSQMQNSRIEQIVNVNNEISQILAKLTVADEDGENGRSAELVNRLMVIEQAESGRLSRSKFDLAEMVQEMVYEWQKSAEEKRIDLRMIIPNDLPIAYGNRDEIQKMLAELIDNGIKHNPKGSKVQVVVQAKDEKVKIAVRDNGIGIWPKDLPFLFEQFYRIRNPHQQQVEGDGLGLAVVKAVATGHGGKAWANSKIGKGTTVIFEIPLSHLDLVDSNEGALLFA